MLLPDVPKGVMQWFSPSFPSISSIFAARHRYYCIFTTIQILFIFIITIYLPGCSVVGFDVCVMTSFFVLTA